MKIHVVDVKQGNDIKRFFVNPTELDELEKGLTKSHMYMEHWGQDNLIPEITYIHSRYIYNDGEMDQLIEEYNY